MAEFGIGGLPALRGMVQWDLEFDARLHGFF
jgi:hypothetical protein